MLEATLQADAREMQLIAAQDDIASPPHRFPAHDCGRKLPVLTAVTRLEARTEQAYLPCANNDAAAATSSPLPEATRPSGRTGVSSRPVRMPWPRATARRLTAQEAMPSPWWTCSSRTPLSASARSMASAWAIASWGSGSSGSTIARTQRGAIPDATKARASSSDSSPASMPMPRTASNSQSSRIPSSPWLAVTRSGSSVQAAMSVIRRSGSGSMAAEVLRDTGTPGHAARTERGADGAQRCGARLRCERLVAVVVVRVQVQGAGASLYRLARLGGEFFGRTGYRGMLAIAVERCLQQAVILRQGRLLLRRRLHADGPAGILPNEVLFTHLPIMEI